MSHENASLRFRIPFDLSMMRSKDLRQQIELRYRIVEQTIPLTSRQIPITVVADPDHLLETLSREEPDGTLHLPQGAWPQDQIADIDMSRWMAKSIVYVVHTQGTRVKLDDYKHRNLHLIIGGIASRLHPKAWDAEAKQIKAGELEGDNAANEPPAIDAGAAGAAAATGPGNEPSDVIS